MSDKIKIIVADDHPLMRKGLKTVLETEERFEVIAQASNGIEAFTALQESPADIITLDVEMPEMSGIEVARKIIEEQVEIKIVFLTMYKDEDMFNEAMDIGASGYVLKENAVDDIVDCIKEVSKGSYYISPLISKYLINRQKKMQSLSDSSPSINDLTKTERNILRMVAQNKTSKEIAEELFIASKTVENHRTNISRKLNLSGSHSLIKFALTNKSIL
ncbi:MAG: response regulator transcription factor [Ignavibacteriae bacterium]|nr:DNA-binding response regulator [Ignavibacteriota bacterium]NOG96862.1 response regulator transcription factor [Ignavibacteriota bacterium]